MDRKQSENKKILNATPLEYDGITFKSKLEVTCYKVLKEKGVNPKYEGKIFTLWEGFSPTVPFYTKNSFKKGNYKLDLLSPKTAIDKRKVGAWHYTPDFYFIYGKFIIYVEIKGFSNDVYGYKRKLFRKLLEKLQKEDTEHQYEFWEIYSKVQLVECLEHLKI